MSRREIAQELECNFNMSGETVFDPQDLKIYSEMIKDPKIGLVSTGTCDWEEYSPSNSYLLAADVARGDGKDFSVCHVVKLETMDVVQSIKANVHQTFSQESCLTWAKSTVRAC